MPCLAHAHVERAHPVKNKRTRCCRAARDRDHILNADAGMPPVLSDPPSPPLNRLRSIALRSCRVMPIPRHTDSASCRYRSCEQTAAAEAAAGAAAAAWAAAIVEAQAAHPRLHAVVERLLGRLHGLLRGALGGALCEQREQQEIGR